MSSQQDPQGDTLVTPVGHAASPALPADSDVVTVLVEVPPGSAGSLPHRHPAPVFGYVVEGELRFELEGDAPRVIRAGEAFSEPGGDRVHWQAGNPSPTIWCRFVAVLIVPPGADLLTYLSAEEIETRQSHRHPSVQGTPVG